MKIGFVGLGKMGSQIVEKLIEAGHDVSVYDSNPELVMQTEKFGAHGTQSREALVSNVGEQAIIWLMIPAGVVENEVQEYINLLQPGSTLIDGGNSNYHDTLRRAERCKDAGIVYMDVGTSGGVLGLESGFSLMVGGDKMTYDRLLPAFEALTHPSGGCSYMGPSGYGHYVKMIHNGIEYSIMQSYAEGYDLLKYGPLPEIDLATVAKIWQKGSIIQSTLNGLIEKILGDNPQLDGIDGYVDASGEGAWTLEAARDAGIKMPALEQAVAVRTASQQGSIFFATKLLAAMRHSFGGHSINSRGQQ
ncbi:decarboxylating 6-phosphogluconate dehydrogenase [Microbacteriaceae bacterium]|nr:decarboxylating 6-phosphogluconate dehydrogenase [Candidatus Saccharibacteria bacterium]